jgi:hypothetical protein
MAISYTLPAGTGTLSPPILNGITEINAPLLESIEISSENDITLSPQGMMTIAGTPISIISSGSMTLEGLGSLLINGFSIVQISNLACDFDFQINSINLETASNINIQCSGNLDLNGNTVNLGLVKINSLTTANILAITAVEGMMVYNSTEQQMFFYQVSPITGTVLGWYNSTGTILL